MTIIFPIVFSMQGLYRNRMTRPEEWVGAGVGTVLGTVVLSGVLLWLRPGNPVEFYSRATLAIEVEGILDQLVGISRTTVEGRDKIPPLDRRKRKDQESRSDSSDSAASPPG